MTEPQERQAPARTAAPGPALKERLTGAVILVVVVVGLVPALLTGRRPSPAAPLAPGVTRTYRIDLVGPRRPPAEDPDHPLPEPEPPAPRAAEAMPGDRVRLAPKAVPQSPAPRNTVIIAPERHTAAPPGAVSPARPPASVPPPSNDEPASGAPGAGNAAATTPASAPAPSSPAAAPVPTASSAPAAWAVQLGAFSGRETAGQLVTSLRAKGFAAFILEYRRDGRVLYRVRVGPEQDRKRAVAIAERLGRDGYKATVAPHP